MLTGKVFERVILKDHIDTLMLNCLGLHLLDQRGLIGDKNDLWIEELRAQLKEYMTIKALSLQTGDLVASEENPGYLRYSYQQIPVFIPWLIIQDLPEKPVLDELIELCSKVKVGKFSTICLSGSALYFGALKCVSDIDILEYEVDSEFDENVIDTPPGFWRLKHKDNYLEYLTKSGFYGTVELTNKIVPIDYTKTGEEASSKSFTYQEGPLVHTPRELHDPFFLGKYIKFLASQTLSYMRNYPEKSAKRLLPLARVLSQEKIANAISVAFDGEVVQDALKVRQKITALRKVKRLSPLDPELQEFILAEIQDIRGATLDTHLTEEEKENIESLASSIGHLCLINKRWLNGLMVA